MDTSYFFLSWPGVTVRNQAALPSATAVNEAHPNRLALTWAGYFFCPWLWTRASERSAFALLMIPVTLATALHWGGHMLLSAIFAHNRLIYGGQTNSFTIQIKCFNFWPAEESVWGQQRVLSSSLCCVLHRKRRVLLTQDAVKHERPEQRVTHGI